MLVEASGEGLIMILDNQQVFFNKTVYSMLGYEDNVDELELSKLFRALPDSSYFDFKNLHKKNNFDATEQIEAELIKKNGDIIDAFLV